MCLWINEPLFNIRVFVSQWRWIKMFVFFPKETQPQPHAYPGIHTILVLFLQFVRRRYGKRSGFSSTGSRIPRSTGPGCTPASIKTSAWMTWRRTSAAPRSTRPWWPEWVLHSSWSAVKLQQLMLCFWPAESCRGRRTRTVWTELPKYLLHKCTVPKVRWSTFRFTTSEPGRECEFIKH